MLVSHGWAIRARRVRLASSVGQEYKDSMSYVITTVRRKGDSPRTMTVDQNSDRDAKSFCANLAAQYQRVTLHGMDAEGILSVVGLWQGGHAKRKLPEQSNLPRVQRARPVDVIEGEVEPVASAMENLREAAEQFVEATDDLDETPIQDEDEDSGETYEGYCVKCRQKREFHGHVETTDAGRRMAKGTCPVCETKMNRILANLPHDEQDWDESAKEDVTQAVVSAAEGRPADEIAAVVSEVAVEFSEAAQQASEAGVSDAEIAGEGQPVKAPRRPPRPRKSDQAKAAKAKEDNPVADLPVAECFKCGQKQPVQERGGMRILMQHSAPGIDRCPGSLTVVQ